MAIPIKTDHKTESRIAILIRRTLRLLPKMLPSQLFKTWIHQRFQIEKQKMFTGANVTFTFNHIELNRVLSTNYAALWHLFQIEKDYKNIENIHHQNPNYNFSKLLVKRFSHVIERLELLGYGENYCNAELSGLSQKIALEGSKFNLSTLISLVNEINVLEYLNETNSVSVSFIDIMKKHVKTKYYSKIDYEKIITIISFLTPYTILYSPNDTPNCSFIFDFILFPSHESIIRFKCQPKVGAMLAA